MAGDSFVAGNWPVANDSYSKQTASVSISSISSASDNHNIQSKIHRASARISLTLKPHHSELMRSPTNYSRARAMLIKLS